MNVCDLYGDDFYVGPGGFTSWEDSDGREVVGMDAHLVVCDWAYCAIARIELLLEEAERQGIDRSVMEEAMRHAPEVVVCSS